MYFSTEAVPAEIPAHVSRFISITGWKPWKRRLDWLNEQIRANPTMSLFVSERFAIELAFYEVRKHYRSTGNYPWPPKSLEQQRLYSFAAMVSRCHHRLSPSGRKRLRGMIDHSLKTDDGFASLAFEMKIAAHLMTKGFDVGFNDMEAGRGFDYLVSQDNAEVEVECKFVSGDIGRKVHLKRVHQLGGVLLGTIHGLLEKEEGGKLVRISIPDRLEGSREQLEEIAGLVDKLISEERLSITQNGYTVSTSGFSLADSPFGQLPADEISVELVQQYLFDQHDVDNRNVLVNFRPTKGAVLIVIESEKKDAVLRGIHAELKDSARKQFSGDRPGIFCCELGDLTEEQLLSLGEDRKGGSGLQYMVTDLLRRRPQIHTIAFTTTGTVYIKEATSQLTQHTSAQETGPSFVFKNPQHPLSKDTRYDIF